MEEKMQDFSSTIIKDVISLIKSINQINSKEYDLAFQISASSDISEQAVHLSNSILGLNKSLSKQIAAYVDGSSNGKKYESINNVNDALENFEPIIELTDLVLERVVSQKKGNNLTFKDICLDEYNGKEQKDNLIENETSCITLKTKKQKTNMKILRAQNIPRPQLLFKDKVNNSNGFVFIPRLYEKPNAKVPLKIDDNEISSDIQSHIYSLGGGSSVVSHPYEYEIKNLEYPESLLTAHEPKMFKPLQDTPLKWITTEKDLRALSKTLNQQSEFAVDLEHHNYRSYQGFVCLMQISTREEDYIIDTLALRHLMYILNSSFTNPNIVKVLHGAESDVTWLQRDFSIYIVNMFDTYFASKALEYKSLSLAFLLSKFAGILVDKKYQLADWRTRPIPQEMETYAREDTHYLLYIYDMLKIELVEKDLLMTVIFNSNDLTLKQYQCVPYTEDSWTILYKKYTNQNLLSPKQLKVFQAIHQWRDQTARDEDESVRYVLPNHMLFRIAEVCPNEASAVLACCNPVPPIVRLHATDIALLISRVLADYDALQDMKEKYLELQKDLEEADNKASRADDQEIELAEFVKKGTPVSINLKPTTSISKVFKVLDQRKVQQCIASLTIQEQKASLNQVQKVRESFPAIESLFPLANADKEQEEPKPSEAKKETTQEEETPIFKNSSKINLQQAVDQFITTSNQKRPLTTEEKSDSVAVEQNLQEIDYSVLEKAPKKSKPEFDPTVRLDTSKTNFAKQRKVPGGKGQSHTFKK